MTTPATAPLDPARMEAAVDQVCHFFEALTPQAVASLGTLYGPHARFKDPFYDVTGLPAIAGIFNHMFVALEAPRFVVTGRVVQGRACFLTWEFHFGFKNFKRNEPQVILGGSHLVFGADGLVALHRDYWDAAEELYEKLPIVGALMRWLKRRANT